MPRRRRPLATALLLAAGLLTACTSSGAAPEGPGSPTGGPTGGVSGGATGTGPGTTSVGADQTKPGPVLLVPGYGGNVHDLDALRDLLTARGRVALEVAVPGDGRGDLAAQAAALDAVARDALAQGAPSVDVVGFSAGGVVARYWVTRRGGAAVTRRVVTIGSPHHGTALAALAGRAGATGVPCPEACVQLRPGSALLAALPEPVPGVEVGGPAWTSIWSAADEVVSPPTSSVLAGAVSVELQDVCSDDRTPHTRLPRTPLVGGIVLRALAVDVMTAAPAAADCEPLRRLP